MEPGHPSLSVRRQCELLGLSRAGLYREPARESDEDLRLKRLIDEQHLATPFYGSRRMTAWLDRRGEAVNRKRVQRLMRTMGLEAIHPGPRATTRDPDHEIPLPAPRRDDRPTRPGLVHRSRLPAPGGGLHLPGRGHRLAHPLRPVVGLSNTLDGRFWLEAVDDALRGGRPEIFNTDRGCQFTARPITGRLKEERVAISMDGRGRALDHVFIEWLRRSLKYEEFYLKSYRSVREMEAGLGGWFAF